MTTIEAMNSAIKALKEAYKVLCNSIHIEEAITVLKAIDQMEKVEPVYQVWRSTDSCGEFYSWDDCDEYTYNEFAEQDRRILFTNCVA